MAAVSEEQRSQSTLITNQPTWAPDVNHSLNFLNKPQLCNKFTIKTSIKTTPYHQKLINMDFPTKLLDPWTTWKYKWRKRIVSRIELITCSLNNRKTKRLLNRLINKHNMWKIVCCILDRLTWRICKCFMMSLSTCVMIWWRVCQISEDRLDRKQK